MTKPLPKTVSLAKKINHQFSAIQSAFWMSFLPISGFSVVLLQSKNFTAWEIGIILSLQSLASIIAQPLISAFATRYQQIPLKRIVALMMLIGGLFTSLLYFMPHLFWPTVFIFMVHGMTVMSAPAFLNALAMQLSNSGLPINYGVARGLGSLSYAVMGILLGKLVDLSGVGTIIPFFVFMALLTAFFLLRLYVPKVPVTTAQKEQTVAPPSISLFKFLRRNKMYTGFCLASIFLFAGHACLNSYLPNIMNALGGTVTDQGITRSIAAAFELPIMFIYVFLSRRVNQQKLIILSAFAFFLKALATFLVPTVAWLFIIQVFQMPAFGLYTPSAVQFSDQSVSDGDRVRAQALSMVASMGIGYVIGNLGGGFIIDAFGLKNMLFLSAIMSFIGFVIMFLFLYKKNDKTGEKKRWKSLRSILKKAPN